jgi:hypothetical protein
MFLVLVMIPGLFTGFLDPSSESEDIAVGTTVELPYWLAQSLCSRRRNIITVEIPKIYKEPYRSVVKHDVCVCVCVYIGAIIGNQVKDDGVIVQVTCIGRQNWIYNFS